MSFGGLQLLQGQDIARDLRCYFWGIVIISMGRSARQVELFHLKLHRVALFTPVSCLPDADRTGQICLADEVLQTQAQSVIHES
jgi:hypothetical protein